MKHPMTPRGYNALRAELQKLKSMRPELARAIEIARGHGDLSENGDYDAAKNKSGMVEGKIRDLEAKLAMADVIDPRKIAQNNKVVFGLSVKVEDLDSGDSKTLTIVGSDESNVERGLISFESPIGKSLIGKETGDVARMHLPGGTREFEVLEIFVDYQDDAEVDIEEKSDE